MSLEILFDTMLRLSPKSLQIFFWDLGFVLCHLVSASTLLIFAIHFSILVASKSPIFWFTWVLAPWFPKEGSFGFFFLSFGVSGHQGSSDMTLIFLEVEDGVEMYQMPKQSQRDDLAKAMIGGRSDPKPKPKSRDTAASKGKGKGRGKPINIPLDNISPELKKILVREMVKGGRAKVVKKSQVKGHGK